MNKSPIKKVVFGISIVLILVLFVSCSSGAGRRAGEVAKISGSVIVIFVVIAIIGVVGTFLTSGAALPIFVVVAVIYWIFTGKSCSTGEEVESILGRSNETVLYKEKEPSSEYYGACLDQIENFEELTKLEHS